MFTKINIIICFVAICFCFLNQVYSGTITQLTNDDKTDTAARIHNGLVVWLKCFGSNCYDVFAWDGLSVDRLTNNDYCDFYPRVHGGKIAWQAKIFSTKTP